MYSADEEKPVDIVSKTFVSLWFQIILSDSSGGKGVGADSQQDDEFDNFPQLGCEPKTPNPPSWGALD